MSASTFPFHCRFLILIVTKIISLKHQPYLFLSRFCHKVCKSSRALISHVSWCQQNAANKAKAEEQDKFVEEVRSIFDYKDWARAFVASEGAAPNPSAPVTNIDSDSESDPQEDAMDIDGPDNPQVAPDPPTKKPKKGKTKRTSKEGGGKKLRRRLRLWQKVDLLNTYETTLQVLTTKFPGRKFTRQDVLMVISSASGRAFGTVSNVFYAEEELRKKFAIKYNRKHFSFGSGQKPHFPKTEAQLLETIKERRKKQYAVFQSWVMAEYAKLAKSENPSRAAKAKFGMDLFLLFLKRNQLARRKPSNLKPMSLLNSQMAVRGWLRFLRWILDGSIPVKIGDTDRLDPTYGRFPLDCRVDKDEVPGNFGSPEMATVSHRGEGSTKVLVPVSWGDRICTLIPMLTPEKLIKKIGIIFRGQGKRKNKAETALYESLPNIQVFFQAKAWVDKNIEEEVLKTMLIPHCKEVRKSYESRGEKFPGLLLVEDNFSAHLTPRVLEAKIKASIFPAFLPPGTTDASQHVDNNNGKLIKKDLVNLFNDYLDKFDWVANPTGKISLRDRRMTMAKFVNQVVEEFETKHPNLVKSTAISCGMAMAIDGTNKHLIHPPLYALLSSIDQPFILITCDFQGTLPTSLQRLSLVTRFTIK